MSPHTHKIKGLHENEFVMAAKIDQLAGSASWGRSSPRDSAVAQGRLLGVVADETCSHLDELLG